MSIQHKNFALGIIGSCGALLATGFLYRYALAPFNQYYLTPFVLIPLIIYGETLKFKWALLFYFIGGVVCTGLTADWVVEAMTDYAQTADSLAWTFLIGVAGGYIGIFFTIGLGAGRLLTAGRVWQGSLSHRLWSYICMAATWTLAEYIRSRFPIALPWALLGYGFGPDSPLVGPVAVVGIYGQSFVAVLSGLLFTGILISLYHFLQKRQFIPGSLILSGLWAFVLVVQVGYTSLTDSVQTPEKPGQKWAIVQANISQSLRWKKKYYAKQTERYLDLSRQAVAAGAKVLVWAETSIQWYLQDDLGQKLTAFFESYPEVYLIVGAPRYEYPAGTNDPELYNSVFLLKAGQVLASYDKKQLLPFAEYFPWRGVDFLANRFASPTEYSFGKGPSTFTIEGTRVGPMICYESVFSSLFANTTKEEPGLIVNLTNDAWFGFSAGPFQHLDFARLMAKAFRLPILRSANTGISGLIDANGQLSGRLDLGTQGFRLFEINTEQSANVYGSIYARFGDWLVLICFLVVAVGCIYTVKNKRA